MKKQRGNVALALLGLIAILAAFGLVGYGWGHNIFLLAQMSLDHVTGIFILRVIGIFMFPLGAILGYVS